MIEKHKFFQFCDNEHEHTFRRFSDYYLLNQLNGLLEALEINTANMDEDRTAKLDEYKSRQMIHQLARQVRGLLARELRLSGDKSDYYQLLGEKQKEIIALQIKNSYKDSNFEKSVKNYEIRIMELERQIENLRHTLGKYQTAEEENVIFKNHFKEIHRIVRQSRKVSDLQDLLDKQIIPQINKCEVDLAELSKALSRQRTNKVKGAISRYAQELDQLSKSKSLCWEELNKSAAGFFTSLEHMQSDNWIKTRLNLSEQYEELHNRHLATLSLIETTVKEAKTKNPMLQVLGDFERLLSRQSQYGFKTISVNGWIGLGTIHCHRHGIHSMDAQKLQQELIQFRSVIYAFQSQFKKILERYPQLKAEIDVNIISFLETQLIGELIEGQSLGSILQIIKEKIKVVTVDNVYNYYSKTDKDLLFNLRIILKAFLEKFDTLRQQHGITIDFDEGLLVLLKDHILDGVDLEDILALYRPPARICEIDRVINRPVYIHGQNERGVPLKVQQGVPLESIRHEGVVLQKGVPIRQQMNKFVYLQNPIAVAHKRQIPVLETKLVDTPIYETITRQQLISSDKQMVVTVKDEKQIVVVQNQDVYAQRIQIKNHNVPYEVVKKEIVQIERREPEVIYEVRQYPKIIQVPTTIPVIFEKTIHQVIEKPKPYIVRRDVQVPVTHKQIAIQSIEVPIQVDRLVEKRVNVIEHCDCQKPQIFNTTTNVPVRYEIPKEVMIQKAHFVKGDQIEKLVEVTLVKQVPLLQQSIKEVMVCFEKLFIQQFWDEKLVVVERQKPIQFIKYEPVELHVEKPVIIKDQVIKEIRVEVPIPIIIEKEVCKIVECRFQSIVEKIVEVPRVQIVQKIVEKIVTVPRIVQKILVVPQIIEKCVVIERPILEFVQIQRIVPYQKIVQKVHQVQCVREILRIQRQPQYIQIKGDPIQTKLIIKEPVEVEVIKEKIVEVIREVQRNIEVEIPVPLVHKMIETVPVQVVRQTPVTVQRQVAIITEVPVFYKQPQVVINDCQLVVQKIVELTKTEVKVVELERNVVLYEQRAVEVPSQPIIITEKQLELVYVDKAPIVEEVEVIKVEPHYLYADKVVKVSEQTFVRPQTVVECIREPQEIRVEKLVVGSHRIESAVQYPTVRFSEVRTILENPQVSYLEKPHCLIEKEIIPGEVVKVEVEVPCERIVENVINVQRQVMVVDSVSNAVYIEKEKLIEGLREIIYKTESYPEYIEKVVQKIVMLPQIVEIEKKVYMIEEINKLIAKDIDITVYRDEYKNEVENLYNKIDVLINRLRANRNRDRAEDNLLEDLNAFYQAIRRVDGMPKIVEIPKEVYVEVEKDRPVLVPVYDNERQEVLQLIISKLVEGISKLRKEDIQKSFQQQIIDIFFSEYSKVKKSDNFPSIIPKTKEGYGGQSINKRQGTANNVLEFVQSRWKSWIRDYDQALPQTQPTKYLSESYIKYRQTYKSRREDYATMKASFMKFYMQNYNKTEETEKINQFYLQIIQNLWGQVEDLKKQLATEQFNRDRLLSDYTNIVRTLKETVDNNQGQNIASTALESVLVNQPSYLTAEQYGSVSSRIISTSERIESRYETTQIRQNYSSEQKLSEMMEQISKFEQQRFDDEQKISDYQRNVDTLKKDLEQLKQFSSTNQNSAYEIRNQVKIEWESRIRETQENYTNQINRLREELSNVRLERSKGSSQIGNENMRLNDELNTLRREHERQIKALNLQIKSLEAQKAKATGDVQRKMTQLSATQQKQLRRQYQTLKKKHETSEADFEKQKQKLTKDYQQKIKSLEDTKISLEDKLKQQSSGQELKIQKYKDQESEIVDYKNRNQKLEKQLEGIRKELDAIKKSNLGRTAYTLGSDNKYSAYEESPNIDSRVQRYRSPQTSELSKQEHEDSQLSKEGYGTRSLQRPSKRDEKKQRRIEETEDIKSASSKFSGKSESSIIFKQQMTMREFMDIRKGDDKNNIMTIVTIKLLDKFIQDFEKGILNSYSPNGIYLHNLNNLQGLFVQFGQNIKNIKSKAEGLYVAPQVHNGKPPTQKSIVFTVAVIWDEMTHYEIYYKNIEDILNQTYQFKVRDSKMNPILKNTLFEMMCKDPEKRLDIYEARRRLSLQRYITSEGKRK